jgi:hypothetical protein
MKLGLFIFIAALLGSVGLFNWRAAVIGALVLAVVEGAIRKWLLPQGSQFVYFAKDVVLLGAYAGFFLLRTSRRRKHESLGSTLTLLLFCSVCWTFLESFNLGTGSLAAGLFGWKAYVIYMPLCFMLSDLFPTSKDFETFLRWYILLALPVTLLGVAQFNAGADSPLNTYAPGVSGTADVSDIAAFGEDSYVRITGTFSYISGYCSYLNVILALLIPVLAWTSAPIWRGIFACALALVIGNVMMTGSRATVLGAVIVIGGFALLTPLTGVLGERKRTWIHWFASAVALIAALRLFQDAFLAFEQRTEGGWEEGKGRLFGAIFEPWAYLGSAGVLGHGNGITQPAVNALRTALHIAESQYAYSSPTDSENSRVMMELGVPGFFLWYSMRIGLVTALWSVRNRLYSPFLRQIALGAFLILLFQFFTVTMFAHTANLYHWFLCGFILLLPKLDAEYQGALKKERQLQPVQSALPGRSRQWRPRGRGFVGPVLPKAPGVPGGKNAEKLKC